jgi:hypothetical protein
MKYLSLALNPEQNKLQLFFIYFKTLLFSAENIIVGCAGPSCAPIAQTR